MATVAAKTMTAEAFFDWMHRPENRDRHCELEQGEIVEISRPGERHGVVCGNTSWLLGSYTRKRGKGYVTCNDTGIILERDPDTVRRVDVALYLESVSFEALDVKYATRLPTLATEVMSPNDRLKKMHRRIAAFQAKGIPLVWLLDPEDRACTVFRLNQPIVYLEEADELTGMDVLPDFHCRVADFFVMPGEVK